MALHFPRFQRRRIRREDAVYCHSTRLVGRSRRVLIISHKMFDKPEVKSSSDKYTPDGLLGRYAPPQGGAGDVILQMGNRTRELCGYNSEILRVHNIYTIHSVIVASLLDGSIRLPACQ